MKKNLKKLGIVIFILLCVSFTNKVYGQSAGTSLTEQGRTYYEVNFWTATQSHINGGTQIYSGRFAFGLSKNIEIGVGASISDPNDPEYPPEIQPGVKWKFYENEKRQITASGGAIAYLPIANRNGTDAFIMTYANISKNLHILKGATLTAGGYALLARDKSFGSRKGWNFVYDQPIHKKISFSAQLVTGKNRFGYFTPGFNITLPKNSNLFIGYSVGNYEYDNHGLLSHTASFVEKMN